MGDLLTFSIGHRRGLRRATSAASWYELGCRLEDGDPGGAAAAYEQALTANPGLPDAWNNRGRVAHEAADLRVAEGCYRLAICADSAVGLYWFNLGVSVEDQGRHAEAIAAYERAIELDPALADAYFNLARLLELIARRAGDELMLRRAVRHLLSYRKLAASTGT